MSYASSWPGLVCRRISASGIQGGGGGHLWSSKPHRILKYCFLLHFTLCLSPHSSLFWKLFTACVPPFITQEHWELIHDSRINRRYTVVPMYLHHSICFHVIQCTHLTFHSWCDTLNQWQSTFPYPAAEKGWSPSWSPPQDSILCAVDPTYCGNIDLTLCTW